MNADRTPQSGLHHDDGFPDIADDRDYTSAPSLLIVGDTAAACAQGVSVAAVVGLPVEASMDVPAAVERLAGPRFPGCVLVELATVPPDDATAKALGQLLSILHANANAGRHGSVISTPDDLIDIVAAHGSHPRVEQLASASQIDRAVALGIVSRLQGGRLRETPGVAAHAAQLRTLAEEVARISGTLAKLVPDAAAPRVADSPAAESDDKQPRDETSDVALIRGMIRARRLRARYFEPELFADPAWDMLLDLAAAHADGQQVAVSSLCIAAAVPATTALRWIRSLTEAGLFVRVADPNDGRRVFIALCDTAADAMRAYLAAARRLAPLSV